jgi:DNA-binding transcriptional LysR family regulator
VKHLPDISIRQLEYLVAVAECDTWAEAATSVGVSASALSQGLGELERRVGVRLFEPEGRRRVLRRAAEPVLHHARQVVSLTGDLMAWSQRVQGGRRGTVRVGMVDVAAVVHFPQILAAFRSERPEVDLVLNVAPSASLIADLQRGALDLVVCVEPPAEAPGIELEPLFTEPLAVFAPPGSSIGQPSGWGPWVLFPEGSHTRAQTERTLAAAGAPLRIAAESHQPDVLRQMVHLGIGWTVLPVSQADDLLPGPVLFDRQLVVGRRTGVITDPAVDDIADRLRTGHDMLGNP